MNKRDERRKLLIEQTAAQRLVLKQNIRSWHNPFSLVERSLASSLRLARLRPAWIVGGIVTFAALRSGHTRKWLLNGLAAWQIVRQLAGK